MPLLYEIEEAAPKRDAPVLNCLSCSMCVTGELEIDDTLYLVGYCRKYGSFMNEHELYSIQNDEGCFE